MSKTSFTKSLMLHIRYPWTAICLLILWVGTALMCALLGLSIQEILSLLGIASAATLIIALIGFRG